MNNSCYRAISPHGLPASYHGIRKRRYVTHNSPWSCTKMIAKFTRTRSRGTGSPPALFIHYRAASFGHCTRYAVCVPLSLDCYGISCFTSTGLIENKNFGNKYAEIEFCFGFLSRSWKWVFKWNFLFYLTSSVSQIYRQSKRPLYLPIQSINKSSLKSNLWLFIGVCLIKTIP